MRSIVIVGVDGFHNRGVEALVMSIITQVAKMRPDIHTRVLTLTPDFDGRNLVPRNVSFHQNGYQSVPAKAMRKVGALFWPGAARLWPALARSRALIRQSSLVIISGGDIFGSDYGGFQNYLTPLEEARRAGVPYAFLGHSIGPIKDPGLARLFAEYARDAALVALRESRSHRYVTEGLGVHGKQVHLTADVAFLLDPGPDETALRRISDLGIPPDRPFVAIALSGGITRFSGLDTAVHLSAWTYILRELTRDPGWPVLLLPHVWRPGAQYNNDLTLAHRLRREVGDGIAVLDGDLGAADYKAVLARAAFVVAERMHAAIAGLSSLVPTSVISYSVKADGIIGDLFPETPAARRPVIPVSSLAQPDQALRLLRDQLTRRAEIREQLLIAVPPMKAAAMSGFELLPLLTAA